MLKATFFPLLDGSLDGVRLPCGDVSEPDVSWDHDEVCGEWGIYVEEEAVDAFSEGALRRVCCSEGPLEECDLLWRTSQSVLNFEGAPRYQEDVADCAEDWFQDEGCVIPRLSKLEPEYTPNIEDLIAELIANDTPLRHTHNVSPQEARQALEKWKPFIEKELHVVEKGFYRTTTQRVQELKQLQKVQELPAKLVYTLKPPGAASSTEEEAKYCKRKARIVCCGNYASPDDADIFASGAAAESLRSCVTYSAWKRWTTGLLDVAGAFMLSPLPQGGQEVMYVVHPPSVLVKLNLAEEDERWVLTHGMYGLRQSPKLWAEFRDRTIQEFRFEAEDKQWMLKQGDAEPNLWALVEVGVPDGEPGLLVLIYGRYPHGWENDIVEDCRSQAE